MSKNFLLIQGGLANQLLQSALFWKLNENSEISFLCDYLLNSKLRIIRGVTPRKASQLLVHNLKKPSYFTYLISRLLVRLNINKNLLYENSLSQVSFLSNNFYIGDGLNPIVFSSKFDAYWFSILEKLDKKFGDPSIINFPVIHRRKGDYSKKRTHKLSFVKELPINYYLSSINYLEKKFKKNINKVYLISDDLKSSTNELKPFLDEIIINSENSAEYDLWLLSRSDTIILSNSTFSCVGAHLASMRKILENAICPNQWFCDDSKNDTRYDLRKNNWWRI